MQRSMITGVIFLFTKTLTTVEERFVACGSGKQGIDTAADHHGATFVYRAYFFVELFGGYSLT